MHDVLIFVARCWREGMSENGRFTSMNFRSIYFSSALFEPEVPSQCHVVLPSDQRPAIPKRLSRP